MDPFDDEEIEDDFDGVIEEEDEEEERDEFGLGLQLEPEEEEMGNE